ncbi:hypothetical protein J6590_030442 [Homalodisca vitripennis]|nr:hypothetical protein J6590_030442 [Homalodisca vitripennis]
MFMLWKRTVAKETKTQRDPNNAYIEIWMIGNSRDDSDADGRDVIISSNCTLSPWDQKPLSPGWSELGVSGRQGLLFVPLTPSPHLTKPLAFHP